MQLEDDRLALRCASCRRPIAGRIRTCACCEALICRRCASPRGRRRLPICPACVQAIVFDEL